MDPRITPGDYWRSWSWLERAMFAGAGLSLAVGGWVVA